MSALQFLRERAGILVAGVIGVSLLLFVVSDFFGSSSGQSRRAKKFYEIGQIDGESVSYQDFDLRIQNLIEIYKLSGSTNIDEATTESIREQTWEQLIREKILESQYKSLGIGVSTEEIDDLVFGSNPHQIVQQLFTDPESGTFNKSFLVNFLKQTEVDETAKKYWLFFENEIVNEMQTTKYNNLVSQGLYVTSKQAEFEKTLNEATVDFSYIVRNYASVPDSAVTITESEIHSYYSDHKEDFRRDALRDIEYVTFDIVPSEEDIKQTEEWIDGLKEEFATAEDPVQFINLSADTRYSGFFSPIGDIPDTLKDFVRKENLNEIFGPYREDESFKIARLIAVANRPDSVHVRHILLSPNTERSIDDVDKLADSLLTLINSGVSFETLALENSDDAGSAQIGGDLGWFPEGLMVVPFNNACFTSRRGEVKKVETSFGIHIIEVLAASGNARKYNVGIIDRTIIAGSETNQRIYSEASQFAGTNNTYEKFTNTIAEQELDKRIANDISPQQKVLPGLDSPRSLIISLFQAEEGEIILDNSEQAVMEIGDKYVVAYCTKIQEEGIAPVSDVRNDIRFILTREKKADVISAEFSDNITDGTTIDDLSRSMDLMIQEATQINFRSYTIQGAGVEPALIAAASVSDEGVLTGPVNGSNGVFMLTVNARTESVEEEDLESLQNRLMSSFQMRGSYEAYEALRKDANIIDQRYKFY